MKRKGSNAKGAKNAKRSERNMHSATRTTPSLPLSFVLPTRDRNARLLATLDALGACPPPSAGGEVVIADNDSERPVRAPRTLANGLSVVVIVRPRNEGAAARNAGVRAASAPWIVMLDDDSHPELGTDLDALARSLAAREADTAAVMADIRLPALARRESGGLPEVFIGCGAAIRRDAFLRAGGYDHRFHYYAEEYDLAARLLLAGARVGFDPAFRVQHHKTDEGRDMNVILARLVRNTAWVTQRYAPEHERRADLRRIRARYRAIARKERAEAGYAEGLRELRRSIAFQRRTPMPAPIWDRFIGLAHAREALQAAFAARPFRTAALAEPGRNEWVVRRALDELGVRTVDRHADPDAIVIGTLSPGPMLDAAETLAQSGRRVLCPWLVPSLPAPVVLHRATTTSAAA